MSKIWNCSHCIEGVLWGLQSSENPSLTKITYPDILIILAGWQGNSALPLSLNGLAFWIHRPQRFLNLQHSWKESSFRLCHTSLHEKAVSNVLTSTDYNSWFMRGDCIQYLWNNFTGRLEPFSSGLNIPSPEGKAWVFWLSSEVSELEKCSCCCNPCPKSAHSWFSLFLPGDSGEGLFLFVVLLWAKLLS